MKLMVPCAVQVTRFLASLLLVLIPGLVEAKVQAPITTSLDVATLPAAGGAGVVVWSGLPQVTPNTAEVVFLLSGPGGAAPVRTSQAVALRAGQVASASYTFTTPGPGVYTIIGAVNMTVGGGQFTQSAMARLEVPASGPARLTEEPKLSAGDFQARAKVTPPQAVAAPLALNTGAFRISGTLKYTDKPYNTVSYTGTAPTPIRRALVEMRDKQGATGYRTLGTTRSDENGYFYYDLASNKDTDGTGLDVYLHVSADTAEAKVTDVAGNTYFYETATQTDWPGGALALGTITLALADSGPWNIFDTALRGYDFARTQGVTPPQVTVAWAVGNKDGTYYIPGASTIMLLGGSNDPDEFDDPVILHEYGHFMEDKEAHSNNPGGSHSWTQAVSRTLAWSEGWATFFSSATRNSPYYFDYSLAGVLSLDLELPTSNPRSDLVEGSVAASLWDIFDGHNDGGDFLSDGMTHIWKVFHGYFNASRQCVMQDFYNGWLAFGLPNQGEVQAILNDHGINYGWSVTPVAYSLSINGGAASTASRTVTLNNVCLYSPAYYLASESPTFTGGAWQAYSAAPGFTLLSAGNGTKTIYFKVKDAANNVSNVLSASITLAEPPPPTAASFAINNGAVSTASRTVTLNNVCTGGQVYYMASESRTFTGALWYAYATAPAFQLSDGNGVKTIYFKVRNGSIGVSAVRSDTITLAVPQPTVAVSSFKINGGAASTASRTVTLNNICGGSPAGYEASERADFSGATWKSYATAPTFTIASAGNGTKTVYFRIKDSQGLMPAVVSAKITLAETTAMAVGGTVSGSIDAAGDYDLYTFTTASAGWVTISVTAGTLADGILSLLDAQGNVLASADNQGSNPMPMISRNLAAGSYTARVAGAAAANVGTYTIALKSGSAYKTLSVGGAAAKGNILGASDVNWYQFTIATAGTYTISTTAGGLTDGVMALYRDGDLAPLAVNDDQVVYSATQFGYPMMPLISMTLTPGTYNVAFQGYQGDLTPMIGDYTIKLASGNSGAPCMALAANWPGSPGTVTSSAPVGLFLFTVTARGSYTVDSAAGTLKDGRMWLYKMALSSNQSNYDLALMGYNDDRAAGSPMPQLKVTLDPGTYLVEMGATTGTGTYTVTLTQP